VNVTYVIVSVVVLVGLGSWNLVGARRRRENKTLVTPQWISDHHYPRDGDPPGRQRR
jgi:hypothetical protein